MVKFISFEQTLKLRSEILRNNLPLNECVFPTDQIESSFHLGFFEKEELISIASFFSNPINGHQGEGYQLRGMATAKGYAKKGYGKQLLHFVVNYLQNENIAYLWCNARTTAVPFYHKIGFDFLSDEFEIEGVGPHYKMILNLNTI